MSKSFTSLLLVAGFSLSTLSASAQRQAEKPAFKQHRIHLGVLSESRGFSLGYEYRPTKLKGLVGFKGFVGYGFDKHAGGTWHTTTHYSDYDVKRTQTFVDGLKEYTLGVEGNILLGKRRHAFEAGLGIALDHFNYGVNYTSRHKELGAYPSLLDLATTPGSKWASHGYLRAGYRYTAGWGLSIGTGLNGILLQGPFTYFYAGTFSLVPYLTLGYAF